MKLTEELAQKIAEKAIDVIGKNVNIMNEDGVIIGSGDPSRIGTLHEIALMVMKEKERKVVDNKNISKFNYSGVKPGINLPIEFQNQIIGVVGITGKPEEVTDFGEILKNMVELTLERDLLYQELNYKKRAKENFYQKLLDDKILEKEEDYLYERSKILGIETRIPRCVLVIGFDASLDMDFANKIKNYLLNKNLDFLVEIIFFRGENLVLIIKFKPGSNKQENLARAKNLSKKLKKFISEMENVNDFIISMGPVINNSKKLYLSYKNAKLSGEISKKINNKTELINYDEINYDYILSLIDEKKEAYSYCNFIFKGNFNFENFSLANSGEIAENLMRNNLNISQTAESMNLHRNTLEYRIKKIDKSFDINLKNLEELFSFLLAYHIYKYKLKQ